MSKVIPLPSGSRQIAQRTRSVERGYIETTKVYIVPHTLSDTFQWLVSQGNIYFYEQLPDEGGGFHSILIDPFSRTEFWLMIAAGNLTGQWQIDVLPSWCFRVSAYDDIDEVQLEPDTEKPVISDGSTILVTTVCSNW